MPKAEAPRRNDVVPPVEDIVALFKILVANKEIVVNGGSPLENKGRFKLQCLADTQYQKPTCKLMNAGERSRADVIGTTILHYQNTRHKVRITRVG